MRTKRQSYLQAFSLIEVTVLLLLITLILSSAIIVDTSKEGRGNREDTLTRLTAIQEALADYLDSKWRYPCVASRTATIGTAEFGVEALSNCESDTSVPSNTLRELAGSGDYVRIGSVPVRTLGLPDEYIGDVWGNRFTYAVSEKHTSSDTYEGSDGSIQIFDAGGSEITPNGSFVVVSHGKDGKGAYRSASGTLPTACGATSNLDVENCDGDTQFTLAQVTDDAIAEASFYDDLMQYKVKEDGGLGNGYAEATLPNPTSALTDFTYIISLNSMPTEWWEAVAANGADIRATDGDSNQLPVDVIEFTDSGSTGSGLIAVKWDGAKASSGTDLLRIWVGNGEALPAAGDAYGQYNAYAGHWAGFWPSGCGNDRTSNGMNLTANGAPTVGGDTGPIDGSKATSLDGTTQYCTNASPPAGYPITMFISGYVTLDGTTQIPMGMWDASSTTYINLRYRMADGGNPYSVYVRNNTGNFGVSSDGGSAPILVLNRYYRSGGVFISTSRRSWLNGAVGGVSGTTINVDPQTVFGIGGKTSATFSGKVSLAQLHTTNLSDAWMAYDADMIDRLDPDQSDFYGTWEWAGNSSGSCGHGTGC